MPRIRPAGGLHTLNLQFHRTALPLDAQLRSAAVAAQQRMRHVPNPRRIVRIRVLGRPIRHHLRHSSAVDIIDRVTCLQWLRPSLRHDRLIPHESYDRWNVALAHERAHRERAGRLKNIELSFRRPRFEQPLAQHAAIDSPEVT